MPISIMFDINVRLWWFCNKNKKTLYSVRHSHKFIITVIVEAIEIIKTSYNKRYFIPKTDAPIVNHLKCSSQLKPPQ